VVGCGGGVWVKKYFFKLLYSSIASRQPVVEPGSYVSYVLSDVSFDGCAI